MIRVEIGNTTIRLFNNVNEASEEAIVRGEGCGVRQIDSGFFVKKGEKLIDIDGEFGKFLSEKEKESLIKGSQPIAILKK